MEPLIYLPGSPQDPRSLELPETSPAMPNTPLSKTPSMALRALDSLRDSHLVPMSPRLEVSQPHSPKPDHEDERREAKADGDNPFPVDRNILRTIIREKLGCEPSHVKFLSSGTFHKAFLVSLVDGPDVVARIARRYMPKLKTESEVSKLLVQRIFLTTAQIATINYVRTHTNIPVPFIYAYDSDPYNKLGGEYIIMSKVRPRSAALGPHVLTYLDDVLQNATTLHVQYLIHSPAPVPLLAPGSGSSPHPAFPFHVRKQDAGPHEKPC